MDRGIGVQAQALQKVGESVEERTLPEAQIARERTRDRSGLRRLQLDYLCNSLEVCLTVGDETRDLGGVQPTPFQLSIIYHNIPTHWYESVGITCDYSQVSLTSEPRSTIVSDPGWRPGFPLARRRPEPGEAACAGDPTVVPSV